MSLKIKCQASYRKSFNCNSFIENSFLCCFLKADHFQFWERVLIKTWQTSFENETTWLEQVSEVFPILHIFPSFIFLPNKRIKNINNSVLNHERVLTSKHQHYINHIQRFWQRWLSKIIYKTERKFWAV